MTELAKTRGKLTIEEVAEELVYVINQIKKKVEWMDINNDISDVGYWLQEADGLYEKLIEIQAHHKEAKGE